MFYLCSTCMGNDHLKSCFLELKCRNSNTFGIAYCPLPIAYSILHIAYCLLPNDCLMIASFLTGGCRGPLGGKEGGGDKLGWENTQILNKAPAKAYKRKPQQTRQK